MPVPCHYRPSVQAYYYLQYKASTDFRDRRSTIFSTAPLLPWSAQVVGLPNGRVAADGSPGRTDDGRVVRDFKLEPIAREV